MTASSTFQNLPAAKRRRILDGALDEFAANGYGGASLNALVAKLGISKGSIFQYFGDKAGLFRAVFNHAVELVIELLRQVRGASQGQDLASRLLQSLAAGLALIQGQPRLFQLYLRIMFEDGAPFRGEMLAAVRVFSRQYMLDLLEDAARAGELRPGLDLEAAVFVLDAVLERFLVAHSQEHLDGGLGLYAAGHELAADKAAVVVETLLAGLGARPC